jgi:SAM-dependent methyltransferase
MDVKQPLAFPDASFDLVNERTLYGVIGPGEWPQVLAECQRILRPGGIIRLTEFEWPVTTSAALNELGHLHTKAFYQFGRSFAVDISRAASNCEAASAVAEKVGIRISAYRVGQGADLIDGEYGWEMKMGVSPDGAVLVRPDGFVAWRSKTLAPLPEALLEQALAQVLGRSMAREEREAESYKR